MAYVFMRNVRHVLQPLATFSASSFSNHAKGVQVGSLRRVLNHCNGEYRSQFNFSSSILLNNLSANSTAVDDVAPTSSSNASRHDSAIPKENTNQKNKKKFQFNTAKTKEAHLKRFNNALSKGIYICRHFAFSNLFQAVPLSLFHLVGLVKL